MDQKFVIDMGIKALAEIDYAIDILWGFAPKNPPEIKDQRQIFSDRDLGVAVNNICSGQALAFDCLFDIGKRRSSESNNAYKLRMERTEFFSNRCNGLKIVELRNRGPRNALAHQDERMLNIIMKFPKSSLLDDIALSHPDNFRPKEGVNIIMRRVYIFSTDTIHIFDESMHLETLRNEVDNVLGRLNLWVANKQGRPRPPRIAMKDWMIGE